MLLFQPYTVCLHDVPYYYGQPLVVWCWPKSAVSYFPLWKLPNTHMIAQIKYTVVDMSVLV